MAIPRPGDYITAKCRRCNDVTGHVVMLILDGEINKVECKACGSVHKYRGDGKVAPPKSTSAAVRHVKAGQTRDQAKDVGTPKSQTIGSSTKPKVSKTALRLNAAKLETAWQESMVRLNIEIPIPYNMRASFEPKTLIEHPKFGRGEVLSVTKPNSMTVLFQDGMKELRCDLSAPLATVSQ